MTCNIIFHLRACCLELVRFPARYQFRFQTTCNMYHVTCNKCRMPLCNSARMFERVPLPHPCALQLQVFAWALGCPCQAQRGQVGVSLALKKQSRQHLASAPGHDGSKSEPATKPTSHPHLCFHQSLARHARSVPMLLSPLMSHAVADMRALSSCCSAHSCHMPWSSSDTNATSCNFPQHHTCILIPCCLQTCAASTSLSICVPSFHSFHFIWFSLTFGPMDTRESFEGIAQLFHGAR